ncbi:MAG: hypothetical protein ACLQU5_13155 [Isosphaeraceae bacterium]
MLDLIEPNITLLDEPNNREANPLDYGITAIQWLYWSWSHGNAQLRHLHPAFMEAIEALILYFDDGAAHPATETAKRLQHHLAFWRNDLDATVHPLSQLGRVVSGDPGDSLEYPGPVFLLTVDEIFEGITHEYVVGEWDLADPGPAHMLIALALLAISEIAMTCYWVLKGEGTHLDTELRRLFGPGNREALIGQLGNVVLAGQVCGWQNRVEFMTEGDHPTPEWVIRRGGRSLFIECTSYKRNAELVNDEKPIRDAIVTAWREKRGKFTPAYSPSVISTDISGLSISREFGTLLMPSLCRRIEMATPTGLPRHLAAYDLRYNWELLQQESQNRHLLGVIASALYSSRAHDNGICGFMAYQGQQILVDLVNDTFRVPKRGFLVWKGEIEDADMEHLLVSLNQPAHRREVPVGVRPPLSIFLV